jgi:hypothetical protein
VEPVELERQRALARSRARMRMKVQGAGSGESGRGMLEGIAGQTALGLAVDLPVSTAGMLGDLGNAGGEDYANQREKFYQSSPMPTVSRVLGAGPDLMKKGLSYLPTSEQIMGGVESITGPIPEPQTTPEKVGRFVGPFLSMLHGAKPPTASVTSAAAPSIATLKRQQGAAYDAAKGSGFRMDPDDYKGLVDDIWTTLSNEGAADFLTPNTAQILKRMIKAAGNESKDYAGLQKFRKWAADVGRSKGPDGSTTPDARTANIIAKKIDEVLEAVPAHAEGNRLTSVVKKSRKLEVAINQAKNAAGANYSQAGLATAIQQKFRAIADQAEKTGWKGWSPAEKDAILGVVNPGKGQAILRGIGAMSPGKGGLSNMFNIGLTATMPMLGIPLMAGTLGAKRLAAAMVNRRADRAVGTTRSGGGALPATQPARLTSPLAKALLSANAATGPLSYQ